MFWACGLEKICMLLGEHSHDVGGKISKCYYFRTLSQRLSPWLFWILEKKKKESSEPCVINFN